jgi:hypothetical protein
MTFFLSSHYLLLASLKLSSMYICAEQCILYIDMSSFV